MASEHNQSVVTVATDALAASGAQAFAGVVRTAIAVRERCTVALSGGSTPRAMFQLLAQPPYVAHIDWSKVFVFWGDERFVPPDDPESNYRMARESLLEHVALPAANIFPVPTVGSAPEEAAQAYAATISSFFDSTPPQFDLILLGMGPDGHTASLFPGHPEVVQPSDALVVAVHNSPKPPPDRISFTYRLINAAQHVIVLVGGGDKASALRAVLAGPHDVVRLPIQGVRPQGQLTWLIDEAAGQELDRS